MGVPVDMMGDYLPPPAPDPSQTLPAGMPTARYPAGRPVAGPQVPGNQMLGTPTMAAATQAVPGQPARPAATAAPALSLDQRRKALEERFMTEAEQEPTAEEITSAYQQSQKEKTAAMQEYLAGQKQRMEMLDPRKIVRQAAPQYVDFAKQVSGPLQILTAIGGKAMGLSGLNMMGALTGMIEGTTQGNLYAYNRAYQTWQDNYDQQREEYNDLKSYVSQMDKYAEGNLQMRNMIAQQGLEMIGVKEQIAKQGLNGLQAMDKTQLQIAKADAEARKIDATVRAQNATARDRAIKEFQKIQNASTRTNAAVNYLQRMKELMPHVIEKYKNQFGVSPKTLGELYVKLQDDPEVSEFQRLTADLKSALVGIELPSGVRGNMYIEKIIGSTSPDLSTQNVSELSTAIAGMQAWAGNVKSVQDRQMQVWNNIAISAGAPNMADVGPGHSYQSPFNFKNADDVKEAVRNGTITYDAGVQVLRDRGWAQ
jgi:hypothetical protein